MCVLLAVVCCLDVFFFFFKQKTAYEMRISDWSSDVCSSDLCAWLPNTAETVIGFLASVSIGAVWSSCSPDFGVATVLDRFGQIGPKLLLLTDGYRYGGKDFDRRAALRELVGQLPSVEQIV